MSQGDEIVIADDGVFSLKVEVSNPRLLGREFSTLSTWIGNRSVATTDLTSLIRTMRAEETSVIVTVEIPATEVQKLQESRDGGVDSTAFVLWNDFDKFRDSSLPASEHVHLNSIADPGEARDLRDEMPERVVEMMRDYEEYSRRNGVLPVPDDYDQRRQIFLNSARPRAEPDR